MKLKVLSLVLLFLFCGAAVALSADTYYLTGEQLNELSKQITSLQSSNKNMMILLENQKKEYLTLENNYLEKYLTMEKQQQNYQNLLNRYESRSLIYKYCIAGAFVVGLVIGVMVVK